MNIVVSYRSIPQAPGYAIGDYCVDALLKLGHNVYPYAKFFGQDTWIKKYKSIDEINADLLIWVECNDGDQQYYELSKLKCKKVVWDFDTALHEVFTIRLLDLLSPSAVFFANKEMSTKYNVNHLPIGAPTSKFFLGGYKNKTHDALCIGNPFQERINFCNNAGVKLVNVVNGDYYRDLLRSTKISVHNFSSGGNGLLVGRVWESMTSGALFFTEQYKYMYDFFKPFVHFVEYKDENDCKDKILFYLKNADDAIKICENAHNEVLGKHTYIHRMENILNTVLKK